MRIFLTLIFTFINFQLLQARVLPLSEYNYPIQSPYIATLTAVSVPTCDVRYTEVLTKYKNIAGQEFEYSFYLSPSGQFNGQVLIVFVGLGSDENNAVAKNYVCEGNKNHYDVIVAPNSFTKDYAKNSSWTGVPGQPYLDAQEIYEYTKALTHTPEFLSLNPRSLSVLGYSHGALMSAHLLEMDRHSGSPLFTNALLINPPVDLLYGIKKLDSVRESTRLSLIKAIEFLTQADKWRKLFRGEPSRERFYSEYEDNFKYDEEDAKMLVSAAFRKSIAPVVEEILRHRYHPDIPSLPPLSSRGYDAAKAKRRLAIGKISYEKYMESFVKRYVYGDEISTESLNAQNSLHVFTDLLKQSYIRIVTSSDDFLLQSHQDIPWLDQILQDRFIAYPRGGHLGNVVFDRNTADLRSWLNSGRFPHEVENLARD